MQNPSRYPENNNNRYGDGFNSNNRYGDNNNNNRFDGGVNGNNRFNDGFSPDRDGFNNVNRYGDRFNSYNNNPNPYDAEYERKLRVENEKLRQLMIEIDTKNSAECTLNVAAQWNFETNVNEVTQLEAVSILCQRDIDLNMLFFTHAPLSNHRNLFLPS